MTTIKLRASRRHITQLGERTGISLDPLTKSRILHGVHVARLLGIETNHAGIVRAAVALYVDHIDGVLKGLATLPEDSPEAKHIVIRETYRLKCANRGGRTPWQDELYLDHALEQAVREFGTRFPEFAELVKQYNAKRPQISIADLPVPGEDLVNFLSKGQGDGQ